MHEEQVSETRRLTKLGLRVSNLFGYTPLATRYCVASRGF